MLKKRRDFRSRYGDREVQHLRKNFVRRQLKEPGLKRYTLLYSSWKADLWSSQGFNLRSSKGRFYDLSDKWCWGGNHHQKCWQNFRPTSGFCRINGKIPQDNRQTHVRILESFSDSLHPTMVGFGSARDLHGFEKRYDVPDSLFHKRMNFEWSFGFEGIYLGSRAD